MRYLNLILFFLLFSLVCSSLSAQLLPKDTSAGIILMPAYNNQNPLANSGETAHVRNQIHTYPAYYTYILLAALVIVSLIRIIAPTYIKELFYSIITPAQLYALYREGKFGFNFTNLLFDIIFIFCFSMVIQMAFFRDRPDLFYLIAAFTAGAYYFKLLLIQVFAYIFFDKSEALWHSLYHLLFTRTSGIILVPCLFFALFQPYFPLHLCIIAILAFLIAIYGLWLIRLFVKMKIGGESDFFYHFLYLCALEISPILILIKNFVS